MGERVKTVTVCGSMRFQKEMQAIAFALETKHHMNVLQCVYCAEGTALSEAERDSLSVAHYSKIDLSDAVYVVDIGGYIGESARQEMTYARERGKDVILHSEFWKK